jgi:aspartyl protease family protein
MSGELPRGLKFATVWLLLGTVVFLGFQWREREAKRATFSAHGDVIEIRRGPDGHYHWAGKLNGRPVEFLVDTGATGVAIPAELATKLRLESEGTVRSRTAGGDVVGQVVRVDLELDGGVRAERLRAVALPHLESPLLGMDVLGRLRWQQQDGALRIDLRPAGEPR